MARIEGRKYYPRSARRRRVEGTVRVSFVLTRSGRVRDLRVREGHMLLRRAASAAVQGAAPLPPPPAYIQCPLRVDYRMQFELR